MNRKILLIVLGIGMAVFATQAGAEDGSEIPSEKRGMILGTMAHLKGVKLRAVAKLPDYLVNNSENEPEVSAFVEFLTKYLGTTQLDLLIEYPPIKN